MTWASHEEYMEYFRNETISVVELDAIYEMMYRQHLDEIHAEKAWLRAAENSMEDCPEWAR